MRQFWLGNLCSFRKVLISRQQRRDEITRSDFELSKLYWPSKHTLRVPCSQSGSFPLPNHKSTGWMAGSLVSLKCNCSKQCGSFLPVIEFLPSFLCCKTIYFPVHLGWHWMQKWQQWKMKWLFFSPIVYCIWHPRSKKHCWNLLTSDFLVSSLF